MKVKQAAKVNGVRILQHHRLFFLKDKKYEEKNLG
jgi:hypothetical protein